MCALNVSLFYSVLPGSIPAGTSRKRGETDCNGVVTAAPCVWAAAAASASSNFASLTPGSAANTANAATANASIAVGQGVRFIDIVKDAAATGRLTS